MLAYLYCIYTSIYTRIQIYLLKETSMVATRGIESTKPFLYCQPLRTMGIYFLLFFRGWFGWSSYISHEETKPREFGLWDCVGFLPGSQSFSLFSAFLPRLGLWLSEPICPARFLSLYHKPWARHPLWGSGWEGEASLLATSPSRPPWGWSMACQRCGFSPLAE